MTETLLKTDARSFVLELGREGKFVVKSGAWEDHRTILAGEVVEVRVEHGTRVIGKASQAASGPGLPVGAAGRHGRPCSRDERRLCCVATGRARCIATGRSTVTCRRSTARAMGPRAGCH
jgi:hypothetical protein